ncbi:MAG: hypothetical protein JWN69_2191, partial [Alphaproteobacteria bacterium]|nr:hypothetical protein [Alphaproteobacteria bacterium]
KRLLPLTAVLAAGAWLLNKYLAGRPKSFAYEGATYVRHPDGRFTSIAGAPVISPQLEKVKAHWANQD